MDDSFYAVPWVLLGILLLIVLVLLVRRWRRRRAARLSAARTEPEEIGV